MEDYFEILVGDPEGVDAKCFELWNEGYTLEKACLRRSVDITSIICATINQVTDRPTGDQEGEMGAGGRGDDQNSRAKEPLSLSSAAKDVYQGESLEDPEVMEMIKQDTADQFRLFELLEPYLYQPEVFVEQTIVQIPGPERLSMLHQYYGLDDSVMREMIWRKPTPKKLFKDLEEIKELTGVPLRSSKRQLDNLKRVYNYVDEQRAIQCIVLREVQQAFCLPFHLACRYSLYIFLAHHKFQFDAPYYHHHHHQQQQHHHSHPTSGGVRGLSGAQSDPSASSAHRRHHHHHRTQGLSFSEIEFIALVIMVYCVPDYSVIIKREDPMTPPSSIPLVLGGIAPSPSTSFQGGFSNNLSEPVTPVYNDLGPSSPSPSIVASCYDKTRSDSLLRVRSDSSGMLSQQPQQQQPSSFMRIRSNSMGDSLPDVSSYRSTLDVMRSVIEVVTPMLEVDTEDGMAHKRTPPPTPLTVNLTCSTLSSTSPPAYLPSVVESTSFRMDPFGILQERLKDIWGVELEKILFVSLRELSRFFNDSQVVDQYQQKVLSCLSAQIPAEGLHAAFSARDSQFGVINETSRVMAIDRKFRSIIRSLSALGWGLSQGKELKDFFQDVIGKVAHSLKELALSRRDICSMFLAMMHTFPFIPLLTAKGITSKRLHLYSVSWTRFLSTVLLCLIKTYSKWSGMINVLPEMRKEQQAR